MLPRKLAYPAFRQPSHVTFGRGAVRVLADADLLPGAVWLLSGDERVVETLRRALESRGMAADEARWLRKPPGEPTGEMIRSCAAWLAGTPHDMVIAVGGGSVLDWARLGMAASRTWLDVDSGRMITGVGPRDRGSLVLVPTGCGSGAEGAAVAVYSCGGSKIPIVSDAFLADRVIADAQFLDLAPPATLAGWLSDALSHGIEAFLSIVPNGFAKEAAISSLQLVLRHHAALAEHCRLDRLLEAGYLGGVAAANCSVGIVHAFAHSVARHGIAHGTANALALDAGLTVNADTPAMRALLDRLGLRMVEELRERVQPVAAAALARGIPPSLQSALRSPAGRDEIVEAMSQDVCLRSNPRRMGRDDLAAFVDDVSRVVAAA